VPRQPRSCGRSRAGSRRSDPTLLSTDRGHVAPVEGAPIVLTGATGFIGSRVARILRARGDAVVAIVRDADGSAADSLRASGVHVATGDLTSEGEMQTVMAGALGVIHIAGVYRVGIPASERPAMYEANVVATQRVLDAAIAAGVARILYISTVNVFGNTHGQVPDESYRRDLAEGFLSYYDETKYLAHVAAEARIEAGAPVVIVQPGTVYGANDHSGIGAQLKAAYDGTARFIGFASTGISPTHVDDIAGGIVAAADRGIPGESYILTGSNIRLGEAMRIAARLAGRKPPRLVIPNVVLRLGARLSPNGGAALGVAPNLREIVSSSDGVTYWASNAKAVAELGFMPRSFEVGIRDAFEGG
jgi:nucleoside-diphosphate-sugar epimerase